VDQLAALAELQKEAGAYEAGAKDYRGTITRIVQHHYEERRKRVITALDTEIDIERKGLDAARAEAIAKLEAFVARYSGVNAHPESTPDAMFRLAALYEERARASTDDSPEALANGLEPAIGLYKRLLVEFPKYREIAGVFYYLGHAYADSARLDEAQQVWRSLVCHDQFVYPTEADPQDPRKDKVAPLPQDHDEEYWRGWEAQHPDAGPAKTSGGAKRPPARAPARPKNGKGGSDLTDESGFLDPFPRTCKPVAQKTATGDEPRYLAEVWWLIGDYHFNEVSRAGGPFNFNRAESAYRHSLEFKKPPVYGVAMYKLAWTYYKQQRYRTSVTQFVQLLKHADEQEKLTGDPGADFRSEAFTYIAGSLTYLDFDGPTADEPYIPRNDVLDDSSLTPDQVEKKMHIGIDRVQDPALIPQDQKWTVDIYKALAQEYRELNQYKNTIELSEIILTKWPMHRDAPVVQNNIADIYDTLVRGAREGTPEYAEFSAKALEARTKLAKYVGNTAWVDANKDDPEAIQTAEKLVRGGLRRAAADHTNGGRALVQVALGDSDKASRDKTFERALKEYQLAAQGWQGYLTQDENSSDAYESRFWLADAHHKSVVITVAMGRSPTQAQVDVARKSAIDVRDSNEDDKYLQPSAFFVVDVSHQQLLDEYRKHKDSSGREGLEERDGVKLENEGTKEVKVIREQVPAPVVAAISAREDYVRRVPPAVDVMKEVDSVKVPQSQVYEFDAANYYFLYGQFAEARKRFQPIYEQQCGKTPFGYKAWERLTTMSNLENDVEQSRKLAEAALNRSCAVSEEQKVKEGDIARPTISRGYYIDAARAFEKAEKMQPGPERDKAWREAAALYKVALEKAPARDEAPEAAMNGAYAYKQVGEYDQAISMYALFIKEYGNEDNLAKLEKGDPKAEPPKAANPTQYQERVKFLKVAQDSLASAYVLFFDYRQAAASYDTISKNKRFEEAPRRDAARNAVILYANVGEEPKMLAARQTLYDLKPPGSQKAEIDYLVASADLKRWDQNGNDDGGNRAARVRAIQSMDAYYTKNKANADAGQYVVQAAYYAAKGRRAGNDAGAKNWCQNTIKAFEGLKAGPNAKEAMGSREADMAAECAFLEIDEQLKAKWDYDTNHHRYAGVIDKVKEAFEKDLSEANDVWFPKLQAVITSFESRPWSVAARARQGSLYDSIRTGLYSAAPPALKMYTPKEEALLAKAEESDREDLQEQADAIRQSRREQWRTARERALNDADKAMVKFYAESVVWGRAWKVRNNAVDHAIRRLAFFTDILGNPKMREFSQGVVDPETKSPFTYTDNYFLRSRPGLTAPLAADGIPAPLPVTAGSK